MAGLLFAKSRPTFCKKYTGLYFLQKVRRGLQFVPMQLSWAQSNPTSSILGPYMGGVGTITGGSRGVLCTELGTRPFWPLAWPPGPLAGDQPVSDSSALSVVHNKNLSES